MITRRVVIIFLDGVGLGEADPEVNPFMHVRLKTLERLLGVSHAARNVAGTITGQAALLGLDTMLNTPGLPQSATGQTTILTGQNASASIGEHYGPYLNQTLRTMLANQSLFKTIAETGGAVAYANAYPDKFLDRVRRSKGRMSANTNAALMAGLKLRGREDLQQGRAVAALLSNDFWPEPEVNLPPLDAYQAGLQLAALAADYTLTFFEFWYTDLLGHRMEREQSIKILAQLDSFIGGVLDGLDLSQAMLLVVSDHGNFENWTTKKHTANPAFTLLVAQEANRFASRLTALTDIKPAIMDYLS